jgi:hypothetical protein
MFSNRPGIATDSCELVARTDSPYGTADPVDVVLQATPPKNWGKITGTIPGGGGAPITGATVAICTMYNTRTGTCGPVTYTLKTGRQRRLPAVAEQGLQSAAGHRGQGRLHATDEDRPDPRR